MEILIRKVLENEWESLQSIGIETFYLAFKDQNTEENMQHYLDDRFSEKQIKKELKEDHSIFYFVVYDANIIGYLKLNHGYAQTEQMGDKALEIERIYLLPEFYGLKIGSLMLTRTEEITRQLNLRTIWLGVWEKNIDAIRFYEKHGFKKFDTHIYVLGNDHQTDWLMQKEIS